jgi:PAS domain S-box-containing protein
MESPTNWCTNEFFRELIQQLPDIIYKINGKGEFIFVNNSVERLGYKPADLIGKHFSVIFQKDDIPSIQHSTAINKSLRNAQSENAPKLFDERRTGKRITKNLRVTLAAKSERAIAADYFHGEVFCSGVYDHDQTEHLSYIGTVGIIRDISELSRTERALSLAERHYRFLIENASDVISIVATDGTILYKSASVEKNLGYKHFDLIGENELDFIHPDDRPFLKSIFTDPEFYRENSSSCELRYVCNHQLWKHFELSITRVLDHENTLMCYVIYSRDISDRHDKERRLREKEEQYRALFEMSADAIFILDSNHTITDCNASAARIFGYERTEIPGRSLDDLRLFEDNESVGIFLSSAQRTLSLPEIACRGRDGFSFPASVTVIPVEKSDDKTIILNIRDMTSRKKTDEEMLKTKKIEYLGILAGGIAHDFNNLLTPISGNISLLKQNTGKNKPDFQLLCEIETAALRAKDLTRQLFTFSKGYTPEKKTMSIEGLLLDISGFILRGSGVLPRYGISKKLWNADIDEGQISQVIQNIIINARQAMPRGGNLRIEAANEVIGPDNDRALMAGDYITITIADEGCGIARDDLHKIFDPYFTMKEGGSGLGLTISYSIIQKHGGTITVDSEKNRGTRFMIYLPASRKKARREKKAEPQMPRGSARVLLLDDDAQIARVARKMLENIHFDCTAAQNAGDAIELFSRALADGKPFDLVILDLTIPGGMGGEEVLKRIRQIDPDVPALVSTGYSDSEVVANCAKHGFNGTLMKPYSLEDLTRVIGKTIIKNKFS